MRRLLRLFVAVGFACLPLFAWWAPPASAFPGGPWSPPVVGPVVRGFEPPATPFGPGHLGVDFSVAPGSAVRAAGDGVVVFAGHVGAGLHVVVLHAGNVRTTDSFLASTAVVRGEQVERGAVLGRSGGTGPQHAADVLHFGVRVGDDDIDPMLLFTPPDLGAIVHLAEPHGGSFGGSAEPSFSAPAAVTESGAIASEVRIDARPALRPPPWWSAATRAPRPYRPTSRPPASPSPSGHDRRGDPMSRAMLAGGAVAPAGALLVLQRRRRADR